MDLTMHTTKLNNTVGDRYDRSITPNRPSPKKSFKNIKRNSVIQDNNRTDSGISDIEISISGLKSLCDKKSNFI